MTVLYVGYNHQVWGKGKIVPYEELWMFILHIPLWFSDFSHKLSPYKTFQVPPGQDEDRIKTKLDLKKI